MRLPSEGGVLKRGWVNKLREEGRDRDHLMRPDDFKRNPLQPAGRRCAYCPTILRRTNPGRICALCQLRAKRLLDHLQRDSDRKRREKKARRRMEKFLAAALKKSS